MEEEEGTRDNERRERETIVWCLDLEVLLEIQFTYISSKSLYLINMNTNYKYFRQVQPMIWTQSDPFHLFLDLCSMQIVS